MTPTSSMCELLPCPSEFALGQACAPQRFRVAVYRVNGVTGLWIDSRVSGTLHWRSAYTTSALPLFGLRK